MTLWDRENMKWDAALRPGSILQALVDLDLGDRTHYIGSVGVREDLVVAAGTCVELCNTNDDGSLWVFLLTKAGRRAQRQRTDERGNITPKAFAIPFTMTTWWTHEGYAR
jgi:hypothetical protein